MGGERDCTDYNTQKALGSHQSIRLRPIRGGGERGGTPSCYCWLLVVLILTDHVCVLQDLKEKKLLEEKENGKDAATNGKVWFPFASGSFVGQDHAHEMLSQDNDENGEPEIGDEEEDDVDEEEEDDDEDDGDGKRGRWHCAFKI